MSSSRRSIEPLILSLTPEPFHGAVWRTHWREVDATDWSLSLRSSGRYHRGRDLESVANAWAALYTSLAPEIALWEMVRRSAARDLNFLRNNVLSELSVDLSDVLDLRDPTQLGLNPDNIVGSDLTVCQLIGQSTIQREAQGIVVPSATGLGANLICFPQNFSDSSSLRLVNSVGLPLSMLRQRLIEPSG